MADGAGRTGCVCNGRGDADMDVSVLSLGRSAGRAVGQADACRGQPSG
ncbi:hypothetical protein C7S13_0026 [Burkholderia cepacia]|nr:hypothetical protein [Burkholderia cepacia]MDW9243518.1 hypothetical protein [Burkholderia cepacia]QOH34305.1 general substrate transporter domain protein [Burkholderia cepacia]